MTKTPEDIAREIAKNAPLAEWHYKEQLAELTNTIAAALRSYADEKLEEAARLIEHARLEVDGGISEFPVFSFPMARLIRSLKSDSPVTR